MSDIDRLEIEVEAQASKANKQLDNLINKLERVSSALTGVNASGLTGFANGISKIASASAQLGNVKTTDFTRLAENLKKMAGVDQSALNRTSASLTVMSQSLGKIRGASQSATQISDLAKNISKLGNKSVQNAMANMPKLASGLNEMMNTLSKAPTVSNNLIQMTNALANFASQGSKVGTAINSMGTTGSKGTSLLSGWLGRLTSSTGRAMRSTKSFSQIAGSFYANFYVVMRGLRKAWSATESSMDFLETVNYFEVAMRKLGDDAAANWEPAGYESAEAYAKSFSERAKQLTTKMTGYEVDEDGNATYAGVKNLGMNPKSVMNYQAMFAQVSESIGVAEESALNFSTALTMLGADWASLRNTTFEEAWGKFASALAGQSRAVRAFGIDITNATLQEYAYKYGLTTAIQEMNQATKAQLRLLAILDQSKVAFGDLANTMESPANQLRMLKQNFSNLARTIGNLFLPIISKVLPYINGLVMALQRLFSWIGGLLGIKFNSINSSIGGMDNDIGNLVDDTDDFTDSVNDANNAVKKLKNTILGFDEINQLNDNSDSSGGGSGSGGGIGGGSTLLDEEITKALEEYQKAWDEAFGRMENKAKDISDRICNAFKRGDYEGIGKYISNGITKGLEAISWNSVYSVAKGFGKGFAEFLNGLITPELFSSVAGTIAGALNTSIYTLFAFGNTLNWVQIGKAIGTGINRFFDDFDFVTLAKTLNVWVDGLETAIGKALETISWGKVLRGLTDFLSNLEFDTVAVIIGTLALKKIGKVTTKKAIKDFVGGKIGKVTIKKAIKDFVGGKIRAFLAGTGFKGLSIGELPILLSSLVPRFQGTAGFDVVADWIISGIDEGLSAILPDWFTEFWGEFIKGFSSAGVVSGGNPFAAVIGGLFTSCPIKIDWGSITSFEWTKGWFDEAKKAFQTAFDGKRADFMDIGGYILEGIIDGFVGALSFIVEPIARFFTEIWDGICDIFGIHSPAKNMNPIGENILLGIVEGFKNRISDFTNAIQSWWNNNVSPWFTKEKWFGLFGSIKNALVEKWNSIVSWWNNTAIVSWWNNNVSPWFTKEKWSFTGIKDGLSEGFNRAIEGIKGIWNGFAKWLNDKLNFKWDAVKIGGKQVVPSGSIQLGKIPTFAQGGYPNTGELFMARENGITEMVGQIGNRSAVANNDQITQAFASEIRPAMTEAFVEALMMTSGIKSNDGQAPVVEVTIKADSETVYNIVRKGKEKSDRRYHVVTEI